MIGRSPLSAATVSVLMLVLQFVQPAVAGRVAADCVILLHGLARTEDSMADLETAASAAGYFVVNHGYPSREAPIEHLARAAIEPAVAECRAAVDGQLHFITHSLGGILVRQFLEHDEVPGLGRVVMLSPPNQGSEAADALVDLKLYQWINGPAGQQLTTGPGGLPAQLGPVAFPLGVITGNRYAFFDSWLAGFFPGPNDGKVSVARARVDGMGDFLVLPYTHPFIMEEPEVIRQSLYFLEHGRFRRDRLRQNGNE
jgi:hypothetical protein